MAQPEVEAIIEGALIDTGHMIDPHRAHVIALRLRAAGMLTPDTAQQVTCDV
jgi:hypothetical protein